MGFYESRAGTPNYKHFQVRYVNDMQPHFQSSVEFVFIKSGSVTVTINGETRTLEKNDGCFIGAFDVHSYINSFDNVGYVLVCDKKYLNNFLSESKGKSLPTFFKFDDFTLLDTLYNLEKENFTETGFSGVINVLLSKLSKSVGLVSRKTNAPSDLICSILTYVENNLDKQISLSVLGEVFGYNSQYVSRVINKYLPFGLKDYVNTLRVEKIHEELSDNVNVLDLAYKWGFESPNTFYRAYLKRFGKQPRK